MAIGFLECAGYGALIYAMDKACKAVDIRILGIDTINPKDSNAVIPLTAQVKFEGNISDVLIALEIAKESALIFNNESDITVSIIERPEIGTRALSEITKVKLRD